jgi:Ser/Thr protein kinase RdoA (MazF antagonist)
MGELASRLTDLLERHYGGRVTALVAIAEYGEGEGGVYRVERRDGPPWVLRLFARDRPLERVRGDAAILEHVGRYGVPVERLIPMRDGSGSTDLNGQGVVVTGFVAGSRPDRGPATLRRLGEALGQLHALPTPAGDPFLGRRAGSLPKEDLRAGHADLARVAGRMPSENLAEYEALQAALDATDDCETLPVGLTHSDSHLDNAILTPDGQPVLIDWVGSGQGPRIAALGVLLYSCAVRAPGDAPDSPWASYWREQGTAPSGVGECEDSLPMQDAVEAVIDGYCRHIVLTVAELERLPDAVRFRPLVIAAREFAQSIESGQLSDSSGWWTRYTEAEAVAAHARTAMERYLSGTPSRRHVPLAYRNGARGDSALQ